MSDNKFREIDVNIEKLENGDLSSQELYNHKMVNWSGPRAPDQERGFYTNYIAKKLLERQNLLELDIKSERSDYFVKTHDGVTKKHTNRSEEIFAKSLLGHSLEHLGKVVGYQMPLKAEQKDKFGKVDLVSFDEDTNTAYLIELKMAEKKETLLRAALEIYTYQPVVKEKVLIEYLENKEERFGITAPNKLSINTAVLFAVKESNLPKELQPEHKDAYQNLWSLLSDLGIGVYTIPETYPVAKYELPNS